MYVHISRDAIAKMMDIDVNTRCGAEDMARGLKITFFPHDPSRVSAHVKTFAAALEHTLKELGVEVIPFREACIRLPVKKMFRLYALRIASIFLFPFRMIRGTHKALDRLDPRVLFRIKAGRKIKPGVSVVALGEGKEGSLPIDFTMSFSKSNVVTILDMPAHITTDTEFHEHFDTMMKLFAHHMTNVAIAVDGNSWVPYNFNASHPRFSRKKDFKKNVLLTLVPKVAAPISPPKLGEFLIEEGAFDMHEDASKEAVRDLTEGASLFGKTKLYPPGKAIGDLPFRNDFYRWVGKIHLDDRNGMSYGFLARQLPTTLSPVLSEKEAHEIFGDVVFDENKNVCIHKNRIIIKVLFNGESWFMEAPEVWVVSQRSGSDKTRVYPEKDLVMLGLVEGMMILRTPKGLKIFQDYKPSFDTKVILAHALGNAIIASLLKKFRPHWEFPRLVEKNGMAIAHWHGYMNKELVPEGWFAHGALNPRVPCSSPQSAIYAFEGKMEAFSKSMEEDKEYRGDVHIEPDHGTNIVFPSLREFASFLYSHPDASRLGNHYFSHYDDK